MRRIRSTCRMTPPTDSQLSKTDWFLEPPSRRSEAMRWALAKVAAGLHHLRGNLRTEGFGILMYHRVANPVPGVDTPTNNVTPDQLRRQLAGLVARGFESWPLSSIVEAYSESRPVPSNVFAVTFDDGFENNFTNALPILRELNVHATIFLATKYLDTEERFPFDDWSASGSKRVPPDTWRPLSLSECDQLLSSGWIEFGAHTHSHQRFTGRSDKFRDDMRTCLEYLSKRFGIRRPIFAFPYGEFDDELVETARQVDISCACTAKSQCVHPGDDLYQWGRFSAGPADTPAMLAAKLSGWYPTLVATVKTIISEFFRRHRLTADPTIDGSKTAFQM